MKKITDLGSHGYSPPVKVTNGIDGGARQKKDAATANANSPGVPNTPGPGRKYSKAPGFARGYFFYQFLRHIDLFIPKIIISAQKEKHEKTCYNLITISTNKCGISSTDSRDNIARRNTLVCKSMVLGWSSSIIHYILLLCDKS